MQAITNLFYQLAAGLKPSSIGGTTVLAVLFASVLIGLYEYIVYRLVSHRSFYNRSFHISLVVLPAFIATIILCLQSNAVITLGTIGALAIIRYRTAVKDPVDMIYMLWSVHTGITCGCGLYYVALLTSAVVTVLLVLLYYVFPAFRKKDLFTLVLCAKPGVGEETILTAVKAHCKNYRVKSRNYTKAGLNLVLEFSDRDPAALSDTLNALEEVEEFSLIAYDSEDIT